MSITECRLVAQAAIARGWLKLPQPDPITGTAPKVYSKEYLREKERSAKKRAEFLAQGLTWDGKPRKNKLGVSLKGWTREQRLARHCQQHREWKARKANHA